MKFAIVVLAVIAAVQAQTYSPFKINQNNPFDRFNPNRYNTYNQNGRYNPNQNRYNPYYSTPAPFRPFSTAAPAVTIEPVTSTGTPYAVTTPSPLPSIVPISRVVSDARSASIVRYENEINPDGSYIYSYETDNGIAAQEQGVPRNLGGNPPVAPVVAQGSFAWTSPEGVPVSIAYTADENGYQPQGNVLPTPPAIPELIARSLAFIARTAPRQ